MPILNKFIWAYGKKPLRLILGAAATAQDGWLSSDLRGGSPLTQLMERLYVKPGQRLNLDVTRREDWLSHFQPGTLHNILSEHVLEHLTWEEMLAGLRLAHEFLCPGGRFRIAVPDGHRPDERYIREVAPPVDGHRQLLTVESLTEALTQTGFTVTPLECYDAHGVFHRTPYDEEQGIVLRCFARDRQENFAYADHYYTSIIVDAVKVKSR